MATPTYSTPEIREIRVMRQPSVERPSLMRWSAVFAGAVLAIGLVYLGTTLWHALAFSSGRSLFADNIGWWDAITSVVVLFLAGLLAGWLSGRPRWYAGLLHGLTVWGLMITGTVVFGVGSALPLLTLSQASSQVANAQPGSFWPSFVAFSIGLVTACFGGIIGGAMPQPMADAGEPGEVDIVDLREPAPAATAPSPTVGQERVDVHTGDVR